MTSYPTNYKEWLAKLISFETVCTRPSNLDLIHYVKAYLESVGIASILVYNDTKQKANLFATLPGEGGVTQGGLVLSGHTDVVSVDGQKWDTNPFQMVEKDGKLYGRGSCDMKGFLAVVLALTPTFLSMKRVKPVHYAFSYDEELGCVGVPSLIEYLKEKGFKADGCVIGEPSDMEVYTGNKGFCEWTVDVHGKAIHSSMALMNTSCNAIEYAAQIITKIREIAMDLKKNGASDSTYVCPFSPISTGIIKGGNAVNTVPAQCDFLFSVRQTDSSVGEMVEASVQAFVKDTVLPSMREECAEAKVEVKKGVSYPAFNAKEESPLTRHARQLRKDRCVHKMGGGTEAGFFQETLGIPSVIVGPGSVKVAHTPNEYVTVADMEASTKFVLDLVKLYTDPKYCQQGNL